MSVEPQPQHEPLEMDARRVLLTGLGLVLLIGGAFGVSAAWLGWLEQQSPLSAHPSPKASESQRNPRLEVTPNQAQQLQRMQQRWRQRLTEYGWVDRQRRLVHIPIERAIDLAAARQMDWQWPAEAPLSRPDATPKAATPKAATPKAATPKAATPKAADEGSQPESSG